MYYSITMETNENKRIVISILKYLLLIVVSIVIFSILTRGKSGYAAGEMVGEFMITVVLVSLGYQLGKYAIKKFKGGK